MKVFWWQAGLHFEPETGEERRALALLLDSAKLGSVFPPPSELTAGSRVLPEQGAEIVVADPERPPCVSGRIVKKLADK